MSQVHQHSSRASIPLDLGLKISQLLTGSWRAHSDEIPASNFGCELAPADLAAITPLLCQSGAGALAWWQLRFTELAGSAAGAELHQVYRRQRLSALIHEREIKLVFSLLAAENIEAVLVKGWSIARRYPDHALRPYGDIDLCVRPDQVACAAAALQCLAAKDGHFVDLHAGFEEIGVDEKQRAKGKEQSTKAKWSRGWDEQFARSRVVELDGQAVRVLGNEDHLRLLCLHLLRSGAWRPPWLCDVALLIESRASDFAWDICMGRDARYADWVAIAISLAQQLLGVCLANTPIEGRSLPGWLAPAVLRQWGRPARATQLHAGEPHVLSELYARWDNPVRATARLCGEFNDWPRLPYRVGELVLRIGESPRQLRRLVQAQRTKS